MSRNAESRTSRKMADDNCCIICCLYVFQTAINMLFERSENILDTQQSGTYPSVKPQLYISIPPSHVLAAQDIMWLISELEAMFTVLVFQM